VVSLVERMLAGDEKPLARLITMVEREGPEVPPIMRLLQPHLGRAYSIGITGPSGSGKSTLVDRLTSLIRKEGSTVGIIAVDPTSPFSGGAVLGDRIRMQQHYLDEGVFIRSMATRGSAGGLPPTARGVIRLLDAFGKDHILVETAGVGQTELDIIEMADTVIVVLTPETGDAIQTMKAGLLEIADIFVVNKADREGAGYILAELMAMLRLHPSGPGWQPPVLAAQAVNDIGIQEVLQAIKDHRRALEETGRLGERRKEQRRKEFLQAVERRLTARLKEATEKDGELLSYLERVEKGELDPYSACQEVLAGGRLLQSWLE